MEKRFMAVLMAVAMVLFLANNVFAATPGGAQVTDNGENTYTPASPQTVDVNAGAIRNADLTAEMSTYRWAGLFGNASGTIVLASGSGLSANKMFEWSANATLVFASTAGSVTWSSLAAATEAQVTTAFSHLNSGSDSYANTFTGSEALTTQTVAAGSIASAPYAITKDDTASDYWKTYALYDGANVVFAGLVVPAGHNSYNGTLSQYQMILPEDGTNTDSNPTTYNVWLELI
ncbi:MAG: hypothetical protein PWP03_804 [Candidatus Woesearchaeota archaeon]|nr:hypothetical protein [Candidatus Woesearchaeota archaeon]